MAASHYFRFTLPFVAPRPTLALVFFLGILLFLRHSYRERIDACRIFGADFFHSTGYLAHVIRDD